MNNDGKILKILEQHGKKLDALREEQQNQGKQLESHGKQLESHGKQLAILTQKIDVQGEFLKIMQTTTVRTSTTVEAVRAGLEDKATKEDLHQLEDFIAIKVLGRLDKHNERIEELEHKVNISHKN